MYYKEETYIMQPFGTVRAVLPGETTALPSVTIVRDEVIDGMAGTGGEAVSGVRLGGWVQYRCRLISARRFAQRCGHQLLEGESAQDILHDALRKALTTAFAETLSVYPETGAAMHGAAWQAGKNHAEDALLDCGWKLTQFRPGRVEVHQEAMK